MSEDVSCDKLVKNSLLGSRVNERFSEQDSVWWSLICIN